MKVTRECSLCLLERALKIGKYLEISDEKFYQLWRELLKYFYEELDETSVPAVVGTARERIIQDVLNLEDPYEEIKARSNTIGRKVAGKIEEEFDFSNHTFNNFRSLFVFAAQANAMEWFIRGHEPDLENFLQTLRKGEEQLVIDETRDLWDAIIHNDKILYLLDNSGEAVIDSLMLKFLDQMDKDLLIGAKSAPILNDITIDEARSLEFDKLGDLIPTGQQVGTLLDDQAPSKIQTAYRKADLVIAKGMGNYETLSEYQFMSTPCFIGLKAKCTPVANHIKVKQGDLVVMRLF